MGAPELTKEMDEWLSRMTKLLGAVEVKEKPIDLLKRGVEGALNDIGVEKLQEMDTAAVLVAVRDGPD